MPCPKFQLIGLLLSMIGGVFIGSALFAMNESSAGASTWARCDISCSDNSCLSTRWTFGLLNNLYHDNSGYYDDATYSNCDSSAQQIFQFVTSNPQKVCSQGKLTLGLGICSLIFTGFGVIISIIAMLADYSWKWMTPALLMYLISATFSSLAGALYRDNMISVLPSITSGSMSIDCYVQVGPMSLMFIGFVLNVVAAALFSPVKCMKPNDADEERKSDSAKEPLNPPSSEGYDTYV